MLTDEHLPVTRVRSALALRVAVGLLLLGAVLNLITLFGNCPFQLSADEAHYWLWSRNLDYGYYSKPPGIAWLYAATTTVASWFGVDPESPGRVLMPVLRVPAVVLGTMSGLLSLLLARRIFRDDRAGLATVVMSAAVPMFAVGSLLITIDSPMYFFWALTVYCLWRHVESRREGGHAGWLYLAGLACAAGMMFKPVLIALPLCAVVGAWMDGGIRRALRTWHAVPAMLLVLASLVPMVVWNANHNWVTFLHISTQGGLVKEATAKPTTWITPVARLGEYVGGQVGGMGVLVFVLMLVAVIVAWRLWRGNGAASLVEEYDELYASGRGNVAAATANRGLAFLLAFTLPLWLFYLGLSLVKETQPNWPAASYFTGMILLGGIVNAGWNSAVAKTRKSWRLWSTVTVVWGIVLVAFLLNVHRLYPLVPAIAKYDPAALKLRGIEERAKLVQEQWNEMRRETQQEPMLVANSYMLASSLSFYMEGHPTVYCVMSSIGGRNNQFDFWPGPNQKDADGKLRFAGRPALIVGVEGRGAVENVVEPAFVHLEGPEVLQPMMNGVPGRKVTVYRGYGFRGFAESRSENW